MPKHRDVVTRLLPPEESSGFGFGRWPRFHYFRKAGFEIALYPTLVALALPASLGTLEGCAAVLVAVFFIARGLRRLRFLLGLDDYVRVGDRTLRWRDPDGCRAESVRWSQLACIGFAPLHGGTVAFRNEDGSELRLALWPLDEDDRAAVVAAIDRATQSTLGRSDTTVGRRAWREAVSRASRARHGRAPATAAPCKAFRVVREPEPQIAALRP